MNRTIIKFYDNTRVNFAPTEQIKVELNFNIALQEEHVVLAGFNSFIIVVYEK